MRVRACFSPGCALRVPSDVCAPSTWERLCTAIKEVLQAAIDHHGTSFSDYVDSEGRQGNFQNQLLVYGRDGKPCRQDGHLIKRIVQAGRSSYYCPGCQR